MLSSVEIRMIQCLVHGFSKINCTLYIFRGWCYCIVIPACATIGLGCCGLSFQTHRVRAKVIRLHIFIMLS